MTCLRRCTCQTDSQNSRRCSGRRTNRHSRRRNPNNRDGGNRGTRTTRHMSGRSARSRQSRRTRSRHRSHRRNWCTDRRTSRRTHRRCEQQRGHGYAKGRERSVRRGADRPVVVTIPSELPPSAPAVDFFARDRRVVRRERQVARLVLRREHPAAGRGEHHRELDEQRISFSLHRSLATRARPSAKRADWPARVSGVASRTVE